MKQVNTVATVAGYALALCLFSLPAAAQERLPGFSSEVAGLIGLQATAISYVGGRSGTPFTKGELQARYGSGAFVGEAGALGLLPLGPSGSNASARLFLRAGVNLTHFRFLLGALADASPDTTVQLLPSFTLTAGSGELRGVLGVFDRGGQIPLRLGVEYRSFSLSYLAAYGIEGAARWPLTSSLSLEGRAFAYALLAFRAIDVSVGVVGKLPGALR
jgi:hypothetical protein